jgi:hypothetical protein
MPQKIPDKQINLTRLFKTLSNFRIFCREIPNGKKVFFKFLHPLALRDSGRVMTIYGS